jgi:hypothetical protein
MWLIGSSCSAELAAVSCAEQGITDGPAEKGGLAVTERLAVTWHIAE